MAVTTENLKRWIEQSNIDYVTYFIKAWIPFNAWYNSHFPALDGERAKINSTKNNANPVRNGISAYLENAGQEGDDFRSYLSALHHGLQNHILTSETGIISFHEIIKESNPKNLVDNETINRIKYYLKREDARRLGEISKIQVFLKDHTNTTFFQYEHTEYDFEHLKLSATTQANFSNLSQKQQEQVRIFFLQLTPIIITNAIEISIKESPKNYYKCDSFNFKRDTVDSYCRGNYVCKSLIETLYQLRNILFHGELIPSDGIQPIYKNAYFLLKMILEKIK
jgi:hypothetical protein